MEITLNHRLCRTHDEVLAAATPQVADFLDEWFSPADFVWGHTSGSTGTPKPLKLSKRDMEESARLTVDFFGITADTTMLLCLSPDYIAGKMMIVRTLLSGPTCWWYRRRAGPWRRLTSRSTLRRWCRRRWSSR